MIWLSLCLAVVSLVISAPLTWWMIGIGRRWGHMDAPACEVHKSHSRAVPATGGIAITTAVLLPLLIILGGVWLIPPDVWTGPFAAVVKHLDGLKQTTPIALSLIGAILTLHVLGLVDDRCGLGPWLKLAVQFIVAALLACFFDMRILELLDQFGPVGWTASLLTSVLWIVIIINAINFLDNMDGLAGGVTCLIACLFLAATLIQGQWFVASLAALTLGAALGFLIFNFPPARVFMGDGGSLVLGLLLAVISIRTTYYSAERAGAWYGLLMPLMVMAVPLYDFTSVTVLRIMRGQSPMAGDQNHFSHRLVRRGMTSRTAVIVIWMCTLATGLAGVMLGSLNRWQAMVAAAQTVAVLIVLALLERANGCRS